MAGGVIPRSEEISATQSSDTNRALMIFNRVKSEKPWKNSAIRERVKSPSISPENDSPPFSSLFVFILHTS